VTVIGHGIKNVITTLKKDAYNVISVTFLFISQHFYIPHIFLHNYRFVVFCLSRDTCFVSICHIFISMDFQNIIRSQQLL
jgi:hypothetical protein